MQFTRLPLAAPPPTPPAMAFPTVAGAAEAGTLVREAAAAAAASAAQDGSGGSKESGATVSAGRKTSSGVALWDAPHAPLPISEPHHPAHVWYSTHCIVPTC